MWQVPVATGDPVYIKQLFHKHVFHIALHLYTYITDHFVLLFLHVHIKQWQVANGFWSVVEDFIQPDGWTYPLMIKITFNEVLQLYDSLHASTSLCLYRGWQRVYAWRVMRAKICMWRVKVTKKEMWFVNTRMLVTRDLSPEVFVIHNLFVLGH